MKYIRTYVDLCTLTGGEAFELWHFDSGETSPPFTVKHALLETNATDRESTAVAQEHGFIFVQIRSEPVQGG